MYIMGDGNSVANESESAIARLKKVLARDFGPKEKDGASDLKTLLDMTKDLKDLGPNQAQLETKSGNSYTLSGDTVASNKLFDNGPPDSPENIKGALELAVMAKAVLEDDTGSIGGTTDPKQMAIVAYASQLAGVKITGLPATVTLDEATKKKLDAAWEEMNPDKKVPKMEAELAQKQEEKLASDAAKPAEPEDLPATFVVPKLTL